MPIASGGEISDPVAVASPRVRGLSAILLGVGLGWGAGNVGPVVIPLSHQFDVSLTGVGLLSGTVYFAAVMVATPFASSSGSLSRTIRRRATALQPGTLEILARAGVVDRTLASSMHLGFARVYDADLGLVCELAFAGSGCPWEFQCSLPQWRTEEILAERLIELGGAVERGVAAVSIEPRDDGVLVGLERADGELETAEAAWVIGAGGAHSLTRSSMDETLEGETYPGVALVGDVRVSCGLPRDGSALVVTPAGYVLLAPLPDERWITFVGDLQPEEAERLASDTSLDAMAATMKRRIASDIQVEDVAWASQFRMHNRLVPRLAERRRFLLGDAGHLSSPIVGEYVAPGEQSPPPSTPGERYPNRAELTGDRHHLLLFGVGDSEGIDRLHRRWDELVDIIHASGDPRQAGVHTQGAALVRPDGHIGFRAVPADAAGIEALDRHLDSYLVPA